MNFKEKERDRERKSGQKRKIRKACLLVELPIKNKNTAVFNGRVYLMILRSVVPEVRELEDHSRKAGDQGPGFASHMSQDHKHVTGSPWICRRGLN